MTEQQEKIVTTYRSNGWEVTDKLQTSGIIVMEILDINPDTKKETPLKAFIDPEGSARIV